ncbi:MAG: hypothetical protein ACLFSM_06250, partial [Thermoplasmata archaeon]
MISVSQVPDHVEAMCGQVLRSGELAHREDLKKSLGKCCNQATYIYSNGGEIKIYSCGVHDKQAIEALQKLEEQQERKALFS